NYSSSNLLTPGEADDWPLHPNPGEFILISVHSNYFDPAVEVLDAKETIVAQNDDMRPGEKASRVLVQLTQAEDYRIRVKSFKSTAGGEYTLNLMRFQANTTSVGTRCSGSLKETLCQWYAFEASAGEVYVLTARAASFAPNLEVYSPVGENIPLEQPGGGKSGQEGALFRAESAGTYYLRLAPQYQNASPRDSYTLTIAISRVFSTLIQQKNPTTLLPSGGMDLWKFSGNAGDIVRIQAETPNAPNSEMRMRLLFLPSGSGAKTREKTNVPPMTILPSNPKKKGILLALLNLSGNYQVFVSQPNGLSVQYVLKMEKEVLSFEQEQLQKNLAIGDSDYFVLNGSTNQLLSIEASSSQFDPYLELYDPQGKLLISNDDGASQKNALLTLLLMDSGRYWVRVKSVGDGGGGTYQLRKLSDQARSLDFGTRVEQEIGEGGSHIWSFTGKAGQVVIASVRSTEIDPVLKLLGPDAVEVVSNDNGGEGRDSLFSVRLPLDGTYTLWVLAKSGSGSYLLHFMNAQ
ncbi:MAG: PPC domain-containing protein, partial [Planctomycetota bacterium]